MKNELKLRWASQHAEKSLNTVQDFRRAREIDARSIDRGEKKKDRDTKERLSKHRHVSPVTIRISRPVWLNCSPDINRMSSNPE